MCTVSPLSVKHGAAKWPDLCPVVITAHSTVGQIARVPVLGSLHRGHRLLGVAVFWVLLCPLLLGIAHLETLSRTSQPRPRAKQRGQYGHW